MPGSGLGLAIVKRAVTSQGGTVDISSRPEGGTKVVISLPLNQDGTVSQGPKG
jgi:signal transduction histidine kinase